VKYAIRELLYIIYLILLRDEKAEIGVRLPQLFQLRRNGGNIKLLLQFAAAILEGLIMQKDDIRSGKLLPGFLRNPDIDILMQ
jgi:hypothetical protein